MRIIHSSQLGLAASAILGLALGNCHSLSALTSVQINRGSSDYIRSSTGTWFSNNGDRGGTTSVATNAIAQSVPSTRDKFLWPFASTSIWNMPIGSGAVYTPANIEPANYVSGDEEYFYKVNASDPLRTVYGPGSFGPGRCTGRQSMNISLPVPDNLGNPE